MAETCDNSDVCDRSMPTPHLLQAPVTPGSEIAEAVIETGPLVPVPGMSDTPPSPPTQFNSAAELTRALRSLGLSKAAAKAVTSGGWSALSKLSGQDETEQPLAELAEAIKAVTDELRRMNDD